MAIYTFCNIIKIHLFATYQRETAMQQWNVIASKRFIC